VLDDKTPGRSLIGKVWGLDCQNHDDACTLNEDILARNPGILSTSIAVHAFLDPRLIPRFESDLGLCRRVYDALQVRTSRIHQSQETSGGVLCGHSAGAVGEYDIPPLSEVCSSAYNLDIEPPPHTSTLLRGFRSQN